MKEVWEIVEDGYYKRIRLVRYPSGLILAMVSGCNCDQRKPWDAFAETPSNAGLIGQFVTEGLAKKAVENWVKSLRKSKTRSGVRS